MLIQPIYNKLTNRPNRWSLYQLYADSTIEYPTIVESHYQHYTTTATATERKIQPIDSQGGDLAMKRQVNIGFLTAQYKYMYERGKYLEVYNDPVNYYGTLPTDYDSAITEAEQRIGNYRVGARRYITHLGGTLDEDQMDDLTTVVNEDFFPTNAKTFPLFPPKPTNLAKAPRILLTTSDVGYVDYIVSKHPTDTTVDAWRAEQGTGFRRFIFAQGNLTSSASATGLKDREVEIEDIETVLDSAIDTATGSVFTTFLPADGEDISVNVPGQHVIRSSSTGLKLEMYDDASFTTLTTSIELPKSTGHIVLTAGTTTVTVNKDGAVAIDAGSNNMTLTAGTLAVTGDLTVSGIADVEGDLTVGTKFSVAASSGNTDIDGTLNVQGVTSHGA